MRRHSKPSIDEVTFTGMSPEQAEQNNKTHKPGTFVQCFLCKRHEEDESVAFINGEAKVGKLKVKKVMKDFTKGVVGWSYPIGSYWLCVECIGLLFGEMLDEQGIKKYLESR